MPPIEVLWRSCRNWEDLCLAVKLITGENVPDFGAPAQESDIISGEFLVSYGAHEIGGEAVLNANGDACVLARGQSTVRCWSRVMVFASDEAHVYAAGDSRVHGWGRAVVTACDKVVVTASGFSQVKAIDSASVTAYDEAVVYASANATVRALRLSVVHAGGKTKVKAMGKAIIYASDQAEIEIGSTADGCIVSISGNASVKDVHGKAIIIEKRLSSGSRKPSIPSALASESESLPAIPAHQQFPIYVRS